MQTVVRWLISVLVLSFTIVAAQNTGGAADGGDPGAIEEVRALEIELCHLLVQGNFEAYAQHVADDYVRVGPDGSMVGKTQVLHAFQSNRIIAMEPEDIRIRVYGGTAVLNVDLRWKQQRPTGLATVHSRVTKTFVKQDKQWLLVSLVEVPLAP